MRASSTSLPDVLTGSFSCIFYVDVFNGGDRVLEDLQVTSFSMDNTLDATLNMSGTCSITYQSEAGESIVPSGLDGFLSPFRATLFLSIEISAGDFVERVGIGWAKVVGIPSARDLYYVEAKSGRQVVYASQVDVNFNSLDIALQGWGFRFPEQPPSLASLYDEVRRISNMPVNETITDRTIPKATVYDAVDGGRLDAVQALFKTLGGMGIIDSSGAWTCVPYTWPTTADLTLQFSGDKGTILDIPFSIDTEGVANVVVGQFQNPTTGAPITAVAYVSTGALATDSDWGEHTRYITDDQVTTQAQANTRVATELATVTASQRYQIDIECLINPLIELGDMVTVAGYIKPLFGRVVKYSISDAPTMLVTLEVQRGF